MTKQEIILGVLSAKDVYQFMADNGQELGIRENEYLRDAITEVRHTADELKSLGERIKRQCDDVSRHVSGQPAPFNSLGALQGDGPRHDALCMLFYSQIRWLQKELHRAGFTAN